MKPNSESLTTVVEDRPAPPTIETAPPPKEVATRTTPRAQQTVIPPSPQSIDYAQAWLRNASKLAMLRDSICPDLDDLEFEVFIEVCKITRLNPFVKQIYAVKRNDKDSPTGSRVTHQTSIDGLRLIAARTGTYAGVDAPVWSTNMVSVSEQSALKLPEWVDCTIYKALYPEAPQEDDRAFSIRLYARDIVPLKKDGTTLGLWFKMGRHLLFKCAQGQCLRMGWPAETAGLYITEEMHAADLEQQFISRAIEKAGGDDKPKRNGSRKPSPATSNGTSNGNGTAEATWVNKVAKFPGKCPGCNNPIRVGDDILYDPHARTAAHPRCIVRIQNHANG